MRDRPAPLAACPVEALRRVGGVLTDIDDTLTHQGAIEPACEMWSVVTESPSTARARAPSMSATGAASNVRPSKNGGLAMYEDAGSHA